MRVRRQAVKMPVVESEFLLALRANDPKHKAALTIFRKYPALEVCTAAFLEITWLLRSKNKRPNEISLILSILKAELEGRGVAEIPLTTSQIARAHDILTRHAMTFFDALILANAEESHDRRMISSDNSFDETGTVERIPLK
jgi:predicted nucleic acid-binding protein